MFVVFKKRDFSDLMNDTISFFKIEGKPFFKNYFTLCGILLLVLFVCTYFLFDMVFAASSSAKNSAIDAFIDNNAGLFFLIILVAAVVTILISIIAMSYPAYYLKAMVEHPKDYQDIKHVINPLKKDIWRLLGFALASFFTIFPLIIIAFSIAAVLIFLLIGIPLLLIMMPAVASWINLAYYEYVTNRSGFFESYQTAYYMLKSKFWIIIGNTFLVYLVIQIVTMTLNIITQIMFYGGTIFSEKSSYDLEETQGFKLMLIGIIILSTLVSFVMNNIMLINQGLVYYSIREQKENTQSHADIDMIGKN